MKTPKGYLIKSQNVKEEPWHVIIEHKYEYFMPKSLDLWGIIYPEQRKKEYINWCYCSGAIIYSFSAAIPEFVTKGLHGVINQQIRAMEK